MNRKIIAVLILMALPQIGVAKSCPECDAITKNPKAYIKKNANTITLKDSLDTVDIVTASISPSCFNWRIVGGCVWLKVTAFPPSVQIRPSVKVAHSIPDVVISTYSEKAENTWDLMSWTDDLSDSLIGGLLGIDFEGGDSAAKNGRKDSPVHIKFKHATAIGNPLASVYGQTASDYFMCKSGATSFMPYYNSIADNWLWRMPTIELVTEFLNIFTPGKATIGERAEGEEYLFTSKWGKIYPRTGFISHVDDYKAAAVIASRVASIVTGSDAVHVGTTANGKAKQGYWPPEDAEEWDSKTGKYQMLFPDLESKCHLFGKRLGTYVTKRDRKGNYAWNLWREYKCCRKEGQKLIAHFGE